MDPIEIATRGSTMEPIFQGNRSSELVEKLAKGFTGREDVLAEIVAAAGLGGRVIMLTGFPGSGKSALMAEVCRRYSSGKPDILISRFIGTNGCPSESGLLFADICRELSAECGVEACEASIQHNISGTFQLLLGKVKRNALILLDGFDLLKDEGETGKESWLPFNIPANVSMLVSFSERWNAEKDYAEKDPGAAALFNLRNRIAPVYEIKLGCLDYHEKNDIITEHLNGLGIEAAEELLSRVSALKGSDNPLYLQLLFDEFSRCGTADLMNFIGKSGVDSLESIMKFRLRRIEHEFLNRFDYLERNLFRDFIRVVLTGRRGLSEGDIRLMLGDWRQVADMSSEQVMLSQYIWAELKRAAAPFLYFDGEYWDLSDLCFRQAAGEAFFKDNDDRRAVRDTFIEYYRTVGYGSRTALMELPHHALKNAEGKSAGSHEWKKAENILCDMGFVEAKAKAELLYELQQDYNEASELLNSMQVSGEAKADKRSKLLEKIEAYKRLVTSQAHLISKYRKVPYFTTQLAYNRAVKAPYSKACRQICLDRGSFMILEKFIPDHEYNKSLDRIIKTSGSSVSKIKISPDGKYLFTAGSSLEKWSMKTGRLIRQYPSLPENTNGMDVSSDGGLIVLSLTTDFDEQGEALLDSESQSGIKALLINAETFEEMGFRERHTSPVLAVRFIRNDIILSGSKDNRIRFWDISAGRFIEEFSAAFQESQSIYAVSDNTVFVADIEGNIYEWNLILDIYFKFTAVKGVKIEILHVTSDERLVLVYCSDGCVRVFDRKTGNMVKILQFDKFSVMCISTFESRIAAFGTSKGSVYIWDLEKLLPVRTITVNKKAVKCLDISADGMLLAAGNDGGEAFVWDLACEETEAWASSYQMENVSEACISIINDTILMGTFSGSLERLNFSGTKFPESTQNKNNAIRSISVSRQQNLAITLNAQNSVQVWDTRDLSCKRERKLIFEEINCFRLMRNSRWALIGGRYGRIMLYDLEDGNGSDLKCGYGCISDICVSPDGRFVAVAGDKESLGLFDINTGLLIKSIDTGMENLTVIKMTPDGIRIIAGDCRGTLKFFDTSDGAFLSEFSGHTKRINCLSVSADGRYLLSGSDDCSIILWEMQSGECRQVFYAGEPVSRLTDIRQDGNFAYCTSDGFLYTLIIKNFELVEPIATACRSWVFRWENRSGHYGEKVSVYCEKCDKSFALSSGMKEAIAAVIKEFSLEIDDSPCLLLPGEVHTRDSLLFKCPECGSAFRLNPFIENCIIGHTTDWFKRAGKNFYMFSGDLADSMNTLTYEDILNCVNRIITAFWQDIYFDFKKLGITIEIGYESMVYVLTDDEKEYLAEKSHERWLKNRLQNGWRYGLRLDIDDRTDPSICPWKAADREKLIKDFGFKNELIGDEELSDYKKWNMREYMRILPKSYHDEGYRLVKNVKQP